MRGKKERRKIDKNRYTDRKSSKESKKKKKKHSNRVRTNTAASFSKGTCVRLPEMAGTRVFTPEVSSDVKPNRINCVLTILIIYFVNNELGPFVAPAKGRPFELLCLNSTPLKERKKNTSLNFAVMT